MKKLVRIELEVEVDPDWIDLCTKYNDLFRTDHCGYWLRGLARTDARGWLVWTFEEDLRLHTAPYCEHLIDRMPDELEKQLHQSALANWSNRNKPDLPLPRCYHRLDVDAACRAWVHGVKKYGLQWYEEADATVYDNVLQLALLGELRYS